MEEVPRKPVDSRRRKRRSDLLIVGGVLVVLAGALVYAARDVITGPQGAAVIVAKPQAAIGPVSVQTAAADSDLIDDDGKTVWTSPTHGPPLDLTYIQPDTEIILALRPAEMLAHPEGEKVLAAFGPLGQVAVAAVERTTGMQLRDIEQLVVGWQMQRDVGWVTTQIVQLRSDIAPSELRACLKHHLSYSTYVFAGDRVYFMKESRGLTGLIDTTPDVLAELFPPEPLFPRDIGRLVRHTDSARQMTIVFRPQFVFGDQHELFAGAMAPLRSAIEEFLGNDIGAASLSMHWDEKFFIELVAVPTLDSSPERTSDELAGRVNELPDLVESVVLGLDVSSYGRRVVARFPEMVRKLAAYTRHGFDKNCAVLRCYLPAVAGHNLLMGAELALAESQGRGGVRAGVSPRAEASSPGSIMERLQKKTSLRFAREELEAALDMLAQDVGVEILIRGQDLQLDGITRNQLFAIDLADAPAAEILVEILRRANPDKLAAGPADPRQKLVYVVGPEAIFITTRAKVAERGERLPDVFLPTP